MVNPKTQKLIFLGMTTPFTHLHHSFLVVLVTGQRQPAQCCVIDLVVCSPLSLRTCGPHGRAIPGTCCCLRRERDSVTNVLLLSLFTTITAIINSEPAIMVNIIVQSIFSKRTLVRKNKPLCAIFTAH